MNTLLKRVAAPCLLGISVVAVGGPSLAQTTPGMDAEGVLDWLDYRQANPLINNYSGPTEFVSVGANIFPSALGYYGSTFSDEVSFFSNTTGSATQGGASFNLFYQDSPALPDWFSRTIPYTGNSALLGSWTLNVKNPSYGTISIPTVPIPPGTPTLPFITNIQASNLTTDATVTWTQPSYTAPAGWNRTTQLFIFDLSLPGNPAIYLENLASTATSFNLASLKPYYLSGSPTPQYLSAGSKYVVEVSTELYDPELLSYFDPLTSQTNGYPFYSGLVSQSRSYIGFTPQSSSEFTGSVQLPSVTPGASQDLVYGFDFSVTGGASYNIDPPAARGFIYTVGAGDPNFASVELPALGNPTPYQLYVWNGRSFVFVTDLQADSIFDFGPGGVNEFEVLGISPSLQLDPRYGTDFVTQVTFVGNGTFNGTMTSVAVPEPSTWAMMLVGFAGLGFMACRRARSLNNAPSEVSSVARTAGKTAPLVFAWILALTGPLPASASQKVALPNGEVLHFGGKGGAKPKHSTDIMQKEHGPGSVAWHILAGTPTIIWDPGDKEVVASWMRSSAGQTVINKWMTKGDTHGTVFHNADVVLKDYFGVSSR